MEDKFYYIFINQINLPIVMNFTIGWFMIFHNFYYVFIILLHHNIRRSWIIFEM